MPLRFASTTSELLTDAIVVVAGSLFVCTDTVIRWICAPVGWVIPPIGRLNENTVLPSTAWAYSSSAAHRLLKVVVATGESLSDSDIPIFSILAHESLNNIENSIRGFFTSIAQAVHTLAERQAEGANLMQNHAQQAIPDGARQASTHAVARFIINLPEYFKYFWHFVFSNSKYISHTLVIKAQSVIAVAPSYLNTNLLRINLDIPQRTEPLDYSLAYWSTRDRILAILLGYVFFSVAGAIYLKLKVLLKENRTSDKADGTVAEVLYQAGGVMKVILIISIEMIVFPLYCGLLLDAALLPLFENATILSRMQFTITSPVTSLFVHWFVGTCYMFHFALFVSMCRNMMRGGVLYFIRDPDDPTFHPVRDVLERSVSTQLRKIAFSAMVYGALVIVCLGTVVWGLSSVLDVFPIHWSSNEPVLEFPVDLLVYNFIMPVAVKFFKPSDGLNSMYDWWFRKCARMLRLSHFLFGEKKEDEEGYLVRRSWWPFSSQVELGRLSPVEEDEFGIRKNTITDPNFIHDGRLVRAPASDQVRIPKGSETFVEVDADNCRLDGLPDTEQGLHGFGNTSFAIIYIPPRFRARICVFIILLWLFAATTGVGITIIPLLFGRYVFAQLTPTHLRMNDVYAFAIGIYALGGPLYLLFHYRLAIANYARSLQRFASSTIISTSTLSNVLNKLTIYTLQALRVLYFYTAFTIVLPSLIALLMEFYLVTPLHTYFALGSSTDPLTPHTIHFIQDWTLGVLVTKVIARAILWSAPSQPALALRALVNGPTASWLDPDIRLATRAFIFPSALLMVLALITPLLVGFVANMTYFHGGTATIQAVVYRYSYPAVLALGLAGLFLREVEKAIRGWRGRIRDEVYLIGERLHNFGERRVGGGVGGRVTTRA